MHVDLTGAAITADPYPIFAQLRRDAPVLGQPLPEGGTIWYVSRYADVRAVLADQRLFVSDYRSAVPEAPPEPAETAPVLRAYGHSLLLKDAPDHTRLRALVSQAFTPRQIQALEPRIQATIAALLADFAPSGSGDLIAALAEPLPVAVIFELLGVPFADRARLQTWVLASLNPAAFVGVSASAADQAAFFAALTGLYGYLDELFAQRRARPGPDLISALLMVAAAGEPVSAEELHGLVQMLIVAGHDTTVNLLGNAVLALLTNPAQLARLLADPTLLDGAIEELLRYDPPVKAAINRWVAADTVLAGQTLRRGDAVRVLLGAANRDPEQFADPDALELGRTPNRALSFGHGVHRCLGAPLARLEARIVLPAIFAQLPNLRLAVPPETLTWRPSVLMRSLTALPVAWDRPETIFS